MIWSIDIPKADWDRLTAKARTDKTTVDAMLTFKVGEYLAAVKREAGQDVDTELQKRLASKTDEEKAALLASL